MIGRGSRSMMWRVLPESWRPLRCMTNTTGAPWKLAPLKPSSDWPEIQPASPVWHTTRLPAPLVPFRPSASPVATGIITPRRPEFSSVPPGTHETWPAMSRLRRKPSTTRALSRKPSVASAE